MPAFVTANLYDFNALVSTPSHYKDITKFL